MAGGHDTGAFALGALTGAEQAAFTAHLADCAECAREAREFAEVTALLGAAARARPRPELRRQAIGAVRATRQLGPVLTEQGDGPAAASRSWWRAPAAWRAALAAALAIVAALGAVVAGQAGQMHRSQRQGQLIAAVLTAPDTVLLTAAVRTGGSATVVMSHRMHALVFTAHGLRRPPPGEAYELWLMGPHGERPAGMLAVRGGGMAGPAVVTGLATGDMVGLTMEPSGGSPRPTSAPVVVIGRPGR